MNVKALQDPLQRPTQTGELLEHVLSAPKKQSTCSMQGPVPEPPRRSDLEQPFFSRHAIPIASSTRKIIRKSGESY